MKRQGGLKEAWHAPQRRGTWHSESRVVGGGVETDGVAQQVGAAPGLEHRVPDVKPSPSLCIPGP